MRWNRCLTYAEALPEPAWHLREACASPDPPPQNRYGSALGWTLSLSAIKSPNTPSVAFMGRREGGAKTRTHVHTHTHKRERERENFLFGFFCYMFAVFQRMESSQSKEVRCVIKRRKRTQCHHVQLLRNLWRMINKFYRSPADQHFMIKTISCKLAGTVKSTFDKKLPIFVNNAPVMRMTMQHWSLTRRRSFSALQNADCEFTPSVNTFIRFFGTFLAMWHTATLPWQRFRYLLGNSQSAGFSCCAQLSSSKAVRDISKMEQVSFSHVVYTLVGAAA